MWLDSFLGWALKQQLETPSSCICKENWKWEIECIQMFGPV